MTPNIHKEPISLKFSTGEQSTVMIPMFKALPKLIKSGDRVFELHKKNVFSFKLPEYREINPIEVEPCRV